ncbi:MICOS complex subunit mic25a-like isoform X1 [Arapaima gigas]
MGASESATRKVTFGADEEDRVQVLHGVKLSEQVLRRMREPSRGGDVKLAPSDTPKEDPGKPPTTAGQQHPFPAPSELLPACLRFDREQAIVQEELARVARREREAAREELSMALWRERIQTRGEAERAQRLAKQLEKKENDLKLLHAFYKEQLAQLEKKNLDCYKTTNRQFEEAAVRIEARVKPRSTEPVCSSLQAHILRCYRENRDQTLHCASLAKEYIQCINDMKKNLLGNHGG